MGMAVEVLMRLPILGDTAWRPGLVVRDVIGVGGKALLSVQLAGEDGSSEVIICCCIH